VACIFLFVDGVGIGQRDPAKNPLAREATLLSHFDDRTGTEMPAGAVAGSADATLGVKGRPQSATGQASIFTGDNAAQFLGRHLLGFPNAALRDFIRERSVFRRLSSAGARVTFANAFPESILRLLGLPHRSSGRAEPELPPAARHAKPSASTCAISAASVPLRTLDDAWKGEAVTHDFTGAVGAARGFDVPVRTPEESARVVLHLAESNDVVLCEHFLLDKAGHAQDFDAALSALNTLDRFLRAIVEKLSAQDTLLVSSDHGNVEDLSTHSHTLNRVPVIAAGRMASQCVASVHEVHDLARAIESAALASGAIDSSRATSLLAAAGADAVQVVRRPA
jgi:2,3-bisphosphoglycerate-independent phosphoglycerate mutase